MIQKEINKQLPKFKNSNPRIQRVLSMLLDHAIWSFTVLPIGMIIFGIIFQFEEYLNQTFGIVIISIPMFIYLNKDFFRGKSGGKRILGYQVINLKTNKPASEFQCFIRNLTIPVWPIEVLVGLINPERRIGDFIANTKVIQSEKEKINSIWFDLKNVKFKLNIIWILIVSAIYFYGIGKLLFFSSIHN